MDETFWNPQKYFETAGQAALEANAAAHFEKLIAAAAVDTDANRAVVAEYEKEDAAASGARAKRNRCIAQMILAGTAVAAGVVGAVTGVFNVGQLIQYGSMDAGWTMSLIPLGPALAWWCGTAMVNQIAPAITNAQEECAAHRDRAEELLRQAGAQMEPLNASFSADDPLRVMEQTVPGLVFEPCFTMENQTLLADHYDFRLHVDQESSVVDTLSGRFAGNPFVFTRCLEHHTRSVTYEGSITINWTETRKVVERDAEGNKQVRYVDEQKSQTLTESLEAPEPYYKERTELGYGHQAAPDLSFSRKPGHAERLSSGSLDWKVWAGERRLRRLSDKAVRTGGSFQQMDNGKFDVLFGADDRDDEVQFRLMYTPLAQCNTVALLTSKTGTGDNFTFCKRGRFNIVSSQHMQGKKLRLSPQDWQSHSVDQAREKFLEDNRAYFKRLFFNFAPLLAVPVYHASAPEFGQIRSCGGNFTRYEHEAVANAFDRKLLVHPRTRTDAILKTRLVGTDGGTDVVNVTAASFTSIERVTYKYRRGGDGNTHQIPIHWTEYLPVERTTTITVAPQQHEQKQNTGGAVVRIHGLVGTIMDNT